MHKAKQKNNDADNSAQRKSWLQHHIKQKICAITPLAGDASFRRYFRVTLNAEQTSYILMDAPPDKESCGAFVNIAQLLQHYQLHVPRIIAQDLQQGFLLLSDLGDRLYLKELGSHNADRLYHQALQALLTMQQIPIAAHHDIVPQWSRDNVLAELSLFTDWYLTHYQKTTLTAVHKQQLSTVFEQLTDTLLTQPQTFVHRDYHSRNLMLTDNNQVAILDFQDAVLGPISYDAVSLLKDCYISWDDKQIYTWLETYYHMLNNAKLLTQTSFTEFVEWFDLTGLQRHLKCLGIFARLHLRDQKSAYLAEIPRIKQYISKVCDKYPDFSCLTTWIK